MANEFKVPDLGENIDEGQVVGILVGPGDAVAADQTVLELETGKATLEVPCDMPGTVAEVLIAEGDTVSVGQPVLMIETGGEGAAPPAAEEPEPTPAPEPAPPAPAAEPAPAEEVPAPPEPAAPTPAAAEMPAPVVPPVAAARDGRTPVRAAPSVRKFAREIGVEIDHVAPLEGEERISLDAVKAHAKQRLQQAPAAGGAAAAGAVAAPPLPDFSAWGPVEIEPMNAIRQMTAQHMAACWSTIPHVTQHDHADVTDLEAFRKRYAKKAERQGVSVTLTAVLLKVVAAALKAHPKFSASIDPANKQVIYKDYCHIGVAVDTPKGLLVPVLRDVDRKHVLDVARELTEAAGKAREGKLAPADMQGGCFTITNLGGIGGGHFTPIVNHPEAAILGVGRAAMQPVWIDGQWVPRALMPLSLSYDHRLIDGADGARFMRWIVDAIADPILVALEGRS